MQILFFFCVYITLFVCQSFCQIPYYFDGKSEVAIGSGEVRTAAYSPDGQFIATAGHAGIQIWDVKNKIYVMNVFTDSSFNYIQWSSNGDLIITYNFSDDDLYIFNFRTLSTQIIQTANVNWKSHSNEIAISYDKKKLFWITKENNLRVYDFETRITNVLLENIDDEIYSCGIMNTENTLYVGYKTGKVIFIDIDTYEIESELDVVGMPIKFSSTDRYIVSEDSEEKTWRDYYYYDRELNQVIQKIEESYSLFNFDKDDLYVYSAGPSYRHPCGDNSRLNVYDLNSKGFVTFIQYPGYFYQSSFNPSENRLLRGVSTCTPYPGAFVNPIYTNVYAFDINTFQTKSVVPFNKYNILSINNYKSKNFLFSKIDLHNDSDISFYIFNTDTLELTDDLNQKYKTVKLFNVSADGKYLFTARYIIDAKSLDIIQDIKYDRYNLKLTDIDEVKYISVSSESNYFTFYLNDNIYFINNFTGEVIGEIRNRPIMHYFNNEFAYYSNQHKTYEYDIVNNSSKAIYPHGNLPYFKVLENENYLIVNSLGQVFEFNPNTNENILTVNTIEYPDYSYGTLANPSTINLFGNERYLTVGNMIWDLENQSLVATIDDDIIRGRTLKVLSVDISSNEKYLLIKYDEGTQKIYSVDKLLNQEAAVEEFQIHEASMN